MCLTCVLKSLRWISFFTWRLYVEVDVANGPTLLSVFHKNYHLASIRAMASIRAIDLTFAFSPFGMVESCVFCFPHCPIFASSCCVPSHDLNLGPAYMNNVELCACRATLPMHSTAGFFFPLLSACRDWDICRTCLCTLNILALEVFACYAISYLMYCCHG